MHFNPNFILPLTVTLPLFHTNPNCTLVGDLTSDVWFRCMFPIYIDPFGRRTVKVFSKRTEADAGQSPSVRLKDGFGRRTVEKFSKRTETDGGQIPLVRLKDEFGRRTGKISKKRTKADAERRRTKSVPRALLTALAWPLTGIFKLHTQFTVNIGRSLEGLWGLQGFRKARTLTARWALLVNYLCSNAR